MKNMDTAPVKAHLLGIGFAVGAIVMHAFLQQRMYSGLAGIGEDYGLGTFIPGILISVMWGATVFILLSKKVVGMTSWAGFVLAGCVAPILATIISFSLPACYPHSPQNVTCDLNSVYKLLSLGGAIPEGRKAIAAFHVVFFTTWLVAAMVGFTITIGRALKRKPATAHAN